MKYVLIFLLFLGCFSSCVNSHSVNETEEVYCMDPGDPPSLYALAWNGETDRIKEILEEHPEQVIPPENEKSALLGAIQSKRPGLVKYLLEKGADLNECRNNWTPLHYAVRDADPETIRLLIEQGADINAVTADYNKYSVLYMATVHNQVELVRFLLEQDTIITSVTPSLLLGATKADNNELFHFLLDRGFEAEDWKEIWRVALARENVEIVRYITETFDTDLNERPEGYREYIPLEIVTRNRHLEGEKLEQNKELLLYLLDKGATPELINNGDVMVWIMENSNAWTFDFFLEKGFRFNGKVDERGRPYLVDALDQLSFHAARYLLQQEEGEPFFRDRPIVLYFADGYSPTTPILEFLIDEKVNTAWYPEAFFQSVMHSDMQSVVLFYRKGLDINVKDEEGRNALWYVKDPDVAEWLILHGIDVMKPAICEQLATNMSVLSVFEKWGLPITLSKEGLDKALRRAARLGNERMVAYFIDKGADVNGFQPYPKIPYWWYDDDIPDFGTPLLLNAWQGYEACSYDRERKISPEVAKLLIRAGADIHFADQEGKTALDYVLGEAWCRCGLWPIPAGTRRQRDRGMHGDPASYPAQDHSLIAIELIKSGADVNRINKEGYSPLILALENYYNEVVPVLLEYGADINYRNKWGWTPLLIAARNGLTDAVRLLLEAGANMNVRTRDGDTPLILAAERGSADIIRLLLDAGADPEVKTRGGKNMFDKINIYAAYSLVNEYGYGDRISLQGFEKMFTTHIEGYRNGLDTLLLDDLLARGVSINLPVGYYSKSALLTILFGSGLSSESVLALLKRGIDVNSRDSSGRTALLLSIWYGQSEQIIKYLLEYGANPYLKDEDGRNAFDYAKGKKNILKLLEEASAK